MKSQVNLRSGAAALTAAILAIMGLPASMAGQTAGDPINAGNIRITGLPEDWSHHHLVFSNPGTQSDAVENGTLAEWVKVVESPRYIMQQLKRGLPAQGPAAASVAAIEAMALSGQAVVTATAKPAKTKIKKDWNESLGSTTAPNNATYSAKWSFSTTSASCADDFVIFPTGQAGSGTQASIIAYYNLYSGCGGTVPKVDWAYNTGGTVALSPVFAANGSQAAFVQTSGTTASLALVTFPLTPPGTGTLTSPIAPASKSNSTYSGCTAPCMTTIAFSGSPNDTISNPYYDYATDSIYVGASNGTLHKFHPVFNGTPAEVSGSGWPLTLDSSNTPTSPIYDSTSGCVFVGDTGGILYSVNSGNSGTVCTSATASKHGTSSQLDGTYGIRDAPLVDSTAGRVYVFAGNDTGGNNGVFQFATNFTSGSGTEVTVGSGGTGTTAYQLAGTFDNTYYTSSNASSPSGNIYMCGTGAPATLYQIPITSNSISGASPVTGPTLADSSYYGRCSPVTEFFNTSVPITATGTITVSGTPSTSWAGVTVTVGTTVYTFVTSSPAASNQVELYTSGSSSSTKRDNTAKNLEAVINANSSDCATSGCVYSSQVANTAATVSSISTDQLNLTATTAGAGGDFALNTSSTSDITISGGQNGSNGTDYIFLSVFIGTESGCTDSTSDGCVMSFNVTVPSSFSSGLTPGGTLNLSAPSLSSPTGGLIIDNGLNSPTGSSQLYFLTQSPGGSSPCTGICAVQAAQTAP